MRRPRLTPAGVYLAAWVAWFVAVVLYAVGQ